TECLDFNCNRRITYETAQGYNTAQFYGVDKKNGQDRYVAGTQDNGSWVSPANPSQTTSWNKAPSGDGFEAVWHYTKTNQLIESSQFNNLFRSDDNGASWRALDLPGDGPFLSRVAGSQQDPDLIFGVTEQGVIKSQDFGDSWQTISMPVGWRFEGLATPIRIALANPNIVWTGAGLRENSEVAISTDGGTTFNLISRYSGATLGLITNIATHPFKDSTAYFLFSQANGPKIIRTDDLGETLEDITGFVTNQEESTNGFPDVATYSFLVMPYDEEIMWAGTEIGLFESTDGGQSWAIADNGLPNAAIWDMKIVNDQIVVATHGRGIWTVNLPELKDYQPLSVDFLAPQILLDDAAFAGRISGEVSLRSAADSSQITFDFVNEGEKKRIEIELPANEADTRVRFDEIITEITGEDFLEVTVTISSFSGSSTLRSLNTQVIHAVSYDPITSYWTNFDDGLRDFALLDWSINTPLDLESGALSSPHPYPNLDLSMAVFQKPVVVTANSQVDFDEIVLVEPGDSEDFPSDDFFDYCQIEATADFGKTWVTIAGYDSRDNPGWLQAYNRDENKASVDLYVHRSFNVSDFFNEGDTIYLRFNLFSDPRLEGWGWSIDNFEINGEVTPVVEFEGNPLEYHVLGNPVSDQLVIDWQSAKTINLNVTIVSSTGQIVLAEKLLINGAHISAWNVSEWSSGAYFLIVNSGSELSSVKWIKL
ncbi:MAG: T9SS type A sorting domain-containing protein, partial [Saprospiraceae bacterium]|nr:T9SS type A sorting domain-containing protein [Saprospiraceae bacterium]